MSPQKVWDFIQQNWRDPVDIAVVAVFVYYILLLIRGTRAIQILQGLVVLLLLQGLFYVLKLQAAYFVLRGLVLSILVALPIVFQPELRRALMQLGARSLVTPFTHVSRDVLVKVIDEIAWAASILSQTRYGALIVIERETGLEEFIEQGVKVNGEVSSKLLLSIFIPRSPLHDGAAILRGDKVVAASCYLPLSELPPTYKDRTYGTRHRAAIGITEQTDAIVVVVSEETGAISIAKDGKLTSNIDEETLKKALLAFLAPPARPATPSVVGPAEGIVKRIRGLFGARPQEAAPAAPPVVTQRIESFDEDVITRELTPNADVPPAPRDPDLATAEQQRIHEEAVQKRAEEAQRRKAEQDAQRAQEEAKRDGDEGEDTAEMKGPAEGEAEPAASEAKPATSETGASQAKPPEAAVSEAAVADAPGDVQPDTPTPDAGESGERPPRNRPRGTSPRPNVGGGSRHRRWRPRRPRGRS